MSAYIFECEDCGKPFLSHKMLIVKRIRFCEICREKEEHVGSNIVLWTDKEEAGLSSDQAGE
jgi:hypothetical protein